MGWVARARVETYVSAGCCCTFLPQWLLGILCTVPPGLVFSEAPIQAPDSILDLESLERKQGNALKQEVFRSNGMTFIDVISEQTCNGHQWAEVCPSSGLSAPLLQQQLPFHNTDQGPKTRTYQHAQSMALLQIRIYSCKPGHVMLGCHSSIRN